MEKIHTNKIFNGFRIFNGLGIAYAPWLTAQTCVTLCVKRLTIKTKAAHHSNLRNIMRETFLKGLTIQTEAVHHFNLRNIMCETHYVLLFTTLY